LRNTSRQIGTEQVDTRAALNGVRWIVGRGAQGSEVPSISDLPSALPAMDDGKPVEALRLLEKRLHEQEKLNDDQILTPTPTKVVPSAVQTMESTREFCPTYFDSHSDPSSLVPDERSRSVRGNKYVDAGQLSKSRFGHPVRRRASRGIVL
jgi:hypothetical protein